MVRAANERGRFIVFEGLDGSGKSTQIELLSHTLTVSGEKVWVTAEPTNGSVGQEIRKMLAKSIKKDMYLQAAMFLADRLEHITGADGIKSHLDDGYTVICDRYYYSSFAYQGTQADMQWVMDINLKCNKIIKPDVCIFLDVEPDTCKNRIDDVRIETELYEKSAKQMNDIRDKFFKVFDILKSHNIVVIDANRPLNEVTEEVVKYV